MISDKLVETPHVGAQVLMKIMTLTLKTPDSEFKVRSFKVFVFLTPILFVLSRVLIL